MARIERAPEPMSTRPAEADRGAHLHQCRSQAVLLAALSVSISVMKRLNR